MLGDGSVLNERIIENQECEQRIFRNPGFNFWSEIDRRVVYEIDRYYRSPFE
jgi:hypothetical protein